MEYGKRLVVSRLLLSLLQEFEHHSIFVPYPLHRHPTVPRIALPWGEGGLHGRLVLDLPTDPRRGHEFLQPSSTYVLQRISGWRHHHDKNVNNVPILVEG